MSAYEIPEPKELIIDIDEETEEKVEDALMLFYRIGYEAAYKEMKALGFCSYDFHYSIFDSDGTTRCNSCRKTVKGHHLVLVCRNDDEPLIRHSLNKIPPSEYEP